MPGLRVFVIESVTLDAYSGKPEWARNLETAGQVGAEIERAVTTQVRKVRLPVWIILAAYLLYTKTAQESPSPKPLNSIDFLLVAGAGFEPATFGL